MRNDRNHPWNHAANYIRAVFVEETNPEAVAAVERAARYLEEAVAKNEASEENT